MAEACHSLLSALANFDGLALLAVVITAFGSCIAYEQQRTNRARFKLDLFEKRFRVFSGARRFLTVIMQDGAVNLEAIYDYRASIGEASFLFKADTTEYLELIYKHALRLNTARETIGPLPVGEKRSQLASEISDELQWLGDQLTELKQVFAPYLGFSEWT